MNKRYLFAMSVAAMLGFTSCAQQDFDESGDDGVMITVNLPHELQTRGVFGIGTDDGDQVKLNNLQWSVFEVMTDDDDNVTDKTLVISGQKEDAFTDSQTTESISLSLAKGKKYQVAFYADDNQNAYASFENGILKVDYSKAAVNTAAEDAFIGTSEIFTVDGSYTGNITLSRPFAQLNWGTNDLDTDAVDSEHLTATVTITKGLFTELDVISGTASEEVSAPVNFTVSSLPEQTFPVEGYKLIAMNYLLVGDKTIDCELSFGDDLSSVKSNNTSVKKNYRTNIYGSLLTSSTNFNIAVQSSFSSPDNDNPIGSKPSQGD